MDRKKYLEEMDFEWYASEHQTVLLAAVKEKEKPRALLKEAEREKEAVLRERDEMLASAQKEMQDIMRERDEAKALYRVLVEHLEGRLEITLKRTSSGRR